jgi:hypothetical protein
MSLTKVSYSMIDGATVNVLDFGAVGDGVANDTAAIQAALLAADKGIVYFPAGTYKCNIVVGNNTRISGAGRRKTIFTAQNTALPIIDFTQSTGLPYFFIGGEDFSVEGGNTAQIGIRIGAGLPTGTVTYGSLDRVYVHECVTGIYMKDTVGFNMTDVFSYECVNNGLLIDTNDIVTIARFTRCNFNQNVTGLNLRGGAVLSFDTCGIESNRNVGLVFNRQTSSGARQANFVNCWFEGNAYAPSTGAASSVFIDLAPFGSDNLPSYLKFQNCVISSFGSEKDVLLNRGNIVDFDTCTFTALNATRLSFNTGNAQAFATLKNCGTINDKPSPTLYASFPDINEGTAGRLQGFAYEYWFNGLRYTNHFPQAFYMRAIIDAAPVGNITGNGAIYTSADLASASTTFELYDYGANFSAGQFTAPEKGIYSFQTSWPITGFSTAMTNAAVYFIVNLSGTPTYYDASFTKISSYGASDIETFNGVTQIRLGKGDSVVSAIKIIGGAGDTADFYRAGAVPGHFFFSGVKVC